MLCLSRKKMSKLPPTFLYAHRVNNPTHLEKIFVNLKPQKPDSNKIKY